MRKIITLIIMLAPVLSLWGQGNPYDSQFSSEELKSDTTVASNPSQLLIKIDAIRHKIDSLKALNVQVLEQCLDCTGISQEDKNNAAEILENTFNNLDSVLAVRDKMVKLNQNKYKYLIFEADTLTKGFINNYRKKISGSNGEVLIQSARFLKIATNYSQLFEKFKEKANKKISEENANNEEESTVENINNGIPYWSTGWIILAIVIALISLGLNIFTLFKIEKKARDIKDNRLQIEELERTLTHKIKEIQGSSVQGLSYQSKPNKYAPTHGLYTGIQQSKKGRTGVPPIIKENPNVEKGNIKPTETQHSGNKPVVHKQPEVTCLYATIKAQSPYAEFFKVTRENAGDKIFMLIQDKPDADTAEFTISDKMTPDFMKSVILDRDTYLPALFCEKAIVSANPTKIIVEIPGKAKKVDGKWMVQDRMTLRLV